MAPAHGAVTRGPVSNFSRPTTANNTSSAQKIDTSHTLTLPREVPASTTSRAPTPHVNTLTTTSPINADGNHSTAGRTGKAQSIIHTLLIITGLIGLGCAAYVLSTLSRWPTEVYNPVVPWDLWPSIVTSSVSILWCTICFFLYLRHTRPNIIHPGFHVSIHLILWLGLVFTVLLSLLAARSMMRYGHDGEVIEYMSMDGYSSSSLGHYRLSTNGTWVWSRNSHLSGWIANELRTCLGSGYPSPSYEDAQVPASDTAVRANAAKCAEQDAGVNDLWGVKTMRTGVSWVVVACQCVGVVGHFALFVWACRETKRVRRGRKVGRGKDGVDGEVLGVREAEKQASGTAERYV